MVYASSLQSDLNDLNAKMNSDDSDEHKSELAIAAAKEKTLEVEIIDFKDDPPADDDVAEEVPAEDAPEEKE